jgi:hypothetical protein
VDSVGAVASEIPFTSTTSPKTAAPQGAVSLTSVTKRAQRSAVVRKMKALRKERPCAGGTLGGGVRGGGSGSCYVRAREGKTLD